MNLNDVEMILKKIAFYESKILALKDSLRVASSLLWINGKPQHIVKEGKIGGDIVDKWKRNKIVKILTVEELK